MDAELRERFIRESRAAGCLPGGVGPCHYQVCSAGAVRVAAVWPVPAFRRSTPAALPGSEVPGGGAGQYPPTAVVFSTDGRSVAVCYNDGLIRVWRLTRS